MSKNANNNGNFPFKGKVVFFATGNVNKFNEARSILGSYGSCSWHAQAQR